MSSRPWRRTLILISLLPLFLVVSGCGGDDGDPTGPDEDGQSNEAPTATIEVPAMDTMVNHGVEVTLRGSGEDPEDGMLDGDQLVWRSDVDDKLGTGKTVTTTLSSDTTHAITLEVTDSEGKADEAKVNIAVLPEQPGEMLSPGQRAMAVTLVESTLEEALPGDQTRTEDRNPKEEVERAARRLVDDVPAVGGVRVNRQTASATILLQDGLEIVLINNRPAGESGSAARQGVSTEGAQTAAGDPPGSAQAHLAVQPHFPRAGAVQSDLAEMLTNGGYQVSDGLSLQDARGFQDLGVLYVDAHATGFADIEVEVEGEEVSPEMQGLLYAISTTTDVGQGHQAKEDFLRNHQQALNEGRLVLSAEPSPNRQQEISVAFTNRFIQEHWSFEDAVVFLHTCFSGLDEFKTEGTSWLHIDPYECSSCSDPLEPVQLRAAVLNAGATAVVGFDHYTATRFAAENIRYFFDRLLGANRFPEVSPPVRPFPVIEVTTGMERRGLTSFQLPNADFWGVFDQTTNLVFDGKLEEAALAPSIHHLEVVDDAAESDGKMTLHGDFGEEEGRVLVAGNEVSVTSWAPDKIVARVPFEGSASSGKVKVEAPPEDIESNPVPLTKWKGSVTGAMEDCDAEARGEAEVRFRADIHRRRDAPAEEAKAPKQVRAYIAPAPETSTQASGTTGDDCEPEVTYTNAKPIETLTKQEVDKGATTTLNASRSTFGGYADLHPRGDEVELCEQLKVAWTAESEGTTQEAFVPVLAEVAAGSGPLHFAPASVLACFTATLNENDGFSAPGSVSYQVNESLRFIAEWSDFTAVSPPGPETPG